jgi:hypothetical protein
MNGADRIPENTVPVRFLREKRLVAGEDAIPGRELLAGHADIMRNMVDIRLSDVCPPIAFATVTAFPALE